MPEGDTGDADIGEAGAGTNSGGDGAAGGNQVLLWSIQTRKFDTRRPQWYYGQVTVNADAPHQVSIVYCRVHVVSRVRLAR